MSSNPSSRKAMVALAALLILVGGALAIWVISNAPSVFGSGEASTASPDASADSLTRDDSRRQPAAAATQPPRIAYLNLKAAPTVVPADEPEVLPIGFTIGLSTTVPDAFRRDLEQVVLPDNTAVALSTDAGAQPYYVDWNSDNGAPLYNVTFAATTRFDTVFPEATWPDLQSAWSGDVTTYTAVAVLTSTIPALEQILGATGPTVQGFRTMPEVVEAAWSDDPTLAFVPFDQLVPSLAPITIDGQNPVENANKFDPQKYPLIATLFTHVGTGGRHERDLQATIDALPEGNRLPNQVTVLTMTGVTAMVRFMAAEMDKRGPAWPAEYVGSELASADITHISNEVPFVEGCKTDLRLDNYNFCSPPSYFETLRLSGVDIIGLTGNHQNDFGRQAAYESLDFYKQKQLPVYGGGRDIEAANKPLYFEHNGNRLAFLGANSYGPELAWAEPDYPGSARFDLNTLSATIRSIKEKDLADIVLVELQYQESYNTTPLADQRENFNALNRAGADIVTGVQSHVPQGMEFTDGKLILYGLGNIYFDQMQSTPTRENLIVRHTFYEGRHLSTQIQTTMLYDFGQPQWMTPDERQALLSRVFANSYWEH